LIQGKDLLYTRGCQLRIIQIPDNETLVFVYQRPSPWNYLLIVRDSLKSIQYDEGLQRAPQTPLEAKPENTADIFCLLNAESGMIPFLIECFEQAIDQQSRFGFSSGSLRAMKSVSLLRRITKAYPEAVSVLEKALILVDETLNSDTALKYEFICDRAGLYLDQGDTERAEKQYSLVEKALRQNPPRNLRHLYFKALEGLAATSFRNGFLQRAEGFLQQVLNLRNSSIKSERLQSLVTLNTLGMIYRALGRSDLARSACERVMASQEKELENGNYQWLRTLHNLACVLYEQELLPESEIMCTRELAYLHMTLGPTHEDTLRAIKLRACLYYEGFKLNKALEAWRSLSNIYEQINGFAHPDSMEAQYRSAEVLVRLGWFSEGSRILQRLLPENEKIFGSSHIITRRTMFLLATLHHYQGNLLESELIRRRLTNNITDGNKKGNGLVSLMDDTICQFD
jgi:tetratricopeptide (TPR) repeat protein